ncbi:MAG: glycoside hydrolase family 97 N-terminal domain-containing protein, partial [Dysgonamonadaceae bacterium]|nr:glycoside hydrolase family 97 N-terminal domain-containing protein [Dysgonamonadaceae bacterium]
MKRYFFTAVLFIVAVNLFAQTETAVQSPDGNYVFIFYQKQKTENAVQMYYRVSYKNKPVIEESTLGLLVENRLFE